MDQITLGLDPLPKKTRKRKLPCQVDSRLLESAAVVICVLYDIDDSSFRDHLVYPKDLADWARANRVVDRLAPGDGAQPLRLRCEGGQPCPQAGFWSTPAQANSRRRFAANELMPTIEGSSWGATIWYWDETQG